MLLEDRVRNSFREDGGEFPLYVHVFEDSRIEARETGKINENAKDAANNYIKRLDRASMYFYVRVKATFLATMFIPITSTVSEIQSPFRSTPR